MYYTSTNSIFRDNNIPTNNCPTDASFSVQHGNLGIGVPFSNMAVCTNTFFRDDLKDGGDGCCRVADSTTSTGNNKTCESYTGSTDYSIGLKILNNDDKYEICQSVPFKKQLPDFQNFGETIVKVLIALIITTIIGISIEFWLKYGTHNEAIHYATNSKELNIIDFLFPIDISKYPYKIDVDNFKGEKLSGGGRFVREFSKGDRSKSSVDSNNNTSSVSKKKLFPYNLFDLKENVDSIFINTVTKSIAIYFLFSIFFARYALNKLYTRCSDVYQGIIGKDDHIKSTIVFFFIMFFTSLILAISFGIGGLIIAIAPIIIFISFILFFFTEQFGFGTYFGLKVNESNKEYFKIFPFERFFKKWMEDKEEKDEDESGLQKIISTVIKVIIVVFKTALAIFILFISLVALGTASNALSLLWFIIHKLFYFFYIPMSGYKEFLNRIKYHGNLLTIIFCLNVIVASFANLNPVAASIISIVLGIIIAAKCYYYFKAQ